VGAELKLCAESPSLRMREFGMAAHAGSGQESGAEPDQIR